MFWDRGPCTEKLIAVNKQNDRDLESEALNLTPNSKHSFYCALSGQWLNFSGPILLTLQGQMLIVSGLLRFSKVIL